ncbi:helix-turn-helix domain-containing protein [Shewanella maritima]|uniref:helix-turn-helix domain-containing protein n=1 Tax=Shewanella maritima TaxID=2520507 RepID=UPI0037362419
MNVSPDKLIELRKDRGWSQEKLAAVSGVSERTIQRAEKDGSCSMETKLAFSNAFEISPSELSFKPDLKTTTHNIEYKTDWAGILGLFIMGLVIVAVVLMTGIDGPWEIVSMAIVWGLTIIISMMTNGALATYRLLDNTSWLVKYPNYVPNLNRYISQAKVVIENAYIIGVCASLVTALTIAIHTNIAQDDLSTAFVLSAKPLIYSILFCELWFRPYKQKMEKMLQTQNEET